MTFTAKIIRSCIATLATVLVPLSGCGQMTGIDFEQVFVGANGPKETGTSYFENQSAIDHSWVRQSLTKAEYATVLKKIDFNHQVLMALAVGQRNAASGAVKITSIKQFSAEKNPSMDVSALVGVVDETCSNWNVVSAPFVLAVVNKPKLFQPVGGMDLGNYRDGCSKVK